MDWRKNRHSAVMLFTALLFSIMAPSALAELITFEVHGHMTDAMPPDLEIGDKFVADYTFDSSVPPSAISDAYVAYNAIVVWHFDFERGYKLASSGNTTFDDIQIVNNSTQDGPPFVDRYIVTLTPVSIDPPLPSDRQIDLLQFYFDDATPSSNPDLLSDSSLITTPPRMELSDYSYGGFLVSHSNLQPFFAIDSIAVVAEPSTAILAIIGIGLLLASNFRPALRKICS